MLKVVFLLVMYLTGFFIQNHSQAIEFIDYGSLETPLMLASKNVDIPEMTKLIQAGEDVNAIYGSDFPRSGISVLGYAINSKSLEAVTILLKAGANPNEFTSYASMIYEEDYSMNCRNIPLLSYAIITNSPINIINALLLNGANPNLRGMDVRWTPLMIAAYHGYTNAVKALLSAGANKDEVNILKYCTKTALDYAKDKNNLEIIDILSSNQRIY